MGATMSIDEGKRPRSKEQMKRTKQVFTKLEQQLEKGKVTKADAIEFVSKRAKQAPAEFATIVNACADPTIIEQFPNLCNALGDDLSVYATADVDVSFSQFSDDVTTSCGDDSVVDSMEKSVATGCGVAKDIDRSLAASAEDKAQKARLEAEAAKQRAKMLAEAAKAEKKTAEEALAAKQMAAKEALDAADCAASEAKEKEKQAKAEAAVAKKEADKIAKAVKKAEKECFENSCGERSVSAKASLERLQAEEEANKAVIKAAQKALREAQTEARKRAAEIKKAEEDCAKVEARKEAERARVAAARAAEARKAADEAEKEAAAATKAAKAAEAKCKANTTEISKAEALLAMHRAALKKAEDDLACLVASTNECAEVEKLQALAQDAQKKSTAAKEIAKSAKAGKPCADDGSVAMNQALDAKENSRLETKMQGVRMTTDMMNQPHSVLMTQEMLNKPIGSGVDVATMNKPYDPAEKARIEAQANMTSRIPREPSAAEVEAARKAAAVPVAAAAAIVATAAPMTQVTKGEQLIASTMLGEPLKNDLRAAYRRVRYLKGLKTSPTVEAELKQLSDNFPQLSPLMNMTDEYRKFLHAVLVAQLTGADVKAKVAARPEFGLVAELDARDILQDETTCLNVKNASEEECGKNSCNYSDAKKSCYDRDFQDDLVVSKIEIAGVDEKALNEFRRHRFLAELVRTARANEAEIAEYTKLPAINRALLRLAAEVEYDKYRRVALAMQRAKADKKVDLEQTNAKTLQDWMEKLLETALGAHLVKLFLAETNTDLSPANAVDARCAAVEGPCAAAGCDFYPGGTFSKAECFDGETKDYDKFSWFDRAVDSTVLDLTKRPGRSQEYQNSVVNEQKLWLSLLSGPYRVKNANALFEDLDARIRMVAAKMDQKEFQNALNGPKYFDLEKDTFLPIEKSFTTFQELYDAITASEKFAMKKQIAAFMKNRINKRLLTTMQALGNALPTGAAAVAAAAVAAAPYYFF